MSLGKLKAFLTLLMALGAVAYFGGDGTLASFSAETSNTGSTIASGTLTMSNSVNSATACLSSGGSVGSPVNNINSSCDKLFQFTNVAPGVYGGLATVTVKDTGSINASKLWVWAPTITGPTLTTAITAGATVTSLALSSLKSALTVGTSITVMNLTNSAQYQTFTVATAASASAGPTTVTVTSATATYSLPVGSFMDVNDCYDSTTTSAPSGAPAGSTYGGNINFNSTAGNPMCGYLSLFVQEIGQTSAAGVTTSYNYCWLGTAGGTGLCVAPITGSLTTATTAGSTSLVMSGTLNGNVATNDTIVVTTASGLQSTWKATADVAYGSTATIPVSLVSGTGVAAAGSTVSDTASIGTLNSDTVNTVTKFDINHDSRTGPIQLAQLTGNGQAGQTALTQLTSGATRTFLVGFMLEAPTGTTQNTIQGLFSTFGLTWHIDQ
jgi:hypothetical protein